MCAAAHGRVSCLQQLVAVILASPVASTCIDSQDKVRCCQNVKCCCPSSQFVWPGLSAYYWALCVLLQAGCTALMLAAREGCAVCVSELLAADARLDLKDNVIFTEHGISRRIIVLANINYSCLYCNGCRTARQLKSSAPEGRLGSCCWWPLRRESWLRRRGRGQTSARPELPVMYFSWLFTESKKS